MRIERPLYLNRLVDRMHNGMVKVITGIRRYGKSYLLFEIFKDYLKKQGTEDDHIIRTSLDSEEYEELLDRKNLGNYVRGQISDNMQYNLLIDEIQMVEGFEKVLNGFLKIENLDVYVTGSNSRFLSTDIQTEFRGRGDEAINALSNVLASSVGSLTSPSKHSSAFASNGIKGITDKTISNYIDYMEDAFLISKATRYDV